MENTEEICEQICKIQKKSKLNCDDMENTEENCEQIWKIRKKSKLNSEKIWKIHKNIMKRYGKLRRKVS
jgi:chorismate mutase